MTFGTNGGSDRSEIYYSATETYLKTINNTSLWFGTNNAERMRIKFDGNVGIGTASPAYTLHVNGSVAGTSAYNNLSDAREKENIVYGLVNALDTVKALKPAKFDFKEGDKGKIGFIAQDVQPLVPEVITSYEKTLPDDTKEERLSIQESSLTAVLVAAVQELSAKVEALEAA
jgi:predicted DNA-binding antitoxin AbrB/MazE fold protein